MDLSSVFYLLIYHRQPKQFSSPIVYEVERGSVIKRSKFLPEMLGITDKIEQIRQAVIKDVELVRGLKKYAKTYKEFDPVFVFDSSNKLVQCLPFETKRIVLNLQGA